MLRGVWSSFSVRQKQKNWNQCCSGCNAISDAITGIEQLRRKFEPPKRYSNLVLSALLAFDF